MAMSALPAGRLPARPYGSMADSLMGFRRTGPNTPYEAQNFSHHQPVRVTTQFGDTFEDSVRGLNRNHAMERANRNWPGAKVEMIEANQLTEPSLIEFFKNLVR